MFASHAVVYRCDDVVPVANDCVHICTALIYPDTSRHVLQHCQPSPHTDMVQLSLQAQSPRLAAASRKGLGVGVMQPTYIRRTCLRGCDVSAIDNQQTCLVTAVMEQLHMKAVFVH